MLILMTGASGFLGSELAKALLGQGDEVWAYRRAETNLHRWQSRQADLRWFDISRIEEPYAQQRHIDAVIHAATCYGRHGEPAENLIQANTLRPVALFEQSQNASVPLFLNIDTALPAQLNAYTLSKSHFADWLDKLAAATRVLHLKTQHFYGPGDDPSKFTDSLLRQLIRETGKIPLTEGRQERDFIYITDAVSAMITALNAAKSFKQIETIEIGSGEAISIRRFAEVCKTLTDSNAQLDFGALPYRDFEVMRSVADTSRVRSLGWSPLVRLEDGLIQTINEIRGGG